MKLVVECWDAVLGCVIADKAISVPEEVIKSLIGIDEIHDGCAYELDKTDAIVLKENFGELPCDEHAKLVLRLRHWMDDLSYCVHTNRELKLMLSGVKPLAAFAGPYPTDDSGADIPEEYFRPHVQVGRLVMRELICPAEHPSALGIRHVLYALPDQTWRLEAYLLLLKTAALAGWNDALERMQGALLGYTDQQNDEFMAKRRASSPSSSN